MTEKKKCPDKDIGGTICWCPLMTLKEECYKIRKENRCPRGGMQFD